MYQRFSRASGVDHRQGEALTKTCTFRSCVQALIIASYRDTRSMSRHPIIITQLRPVRPSLDNRLTARNYRNLESAGVGGRPRRGSVADLWRGSTVVLHVAPERAGDQGQNAPFSRSFFLSISSDPHARPSTLMIVPRTPIPLRCVTRDSR